MKFDIITIFPAIFDSYFSCSILGRAKKNKLIEIAVHNLRDYTTDKHQTVDDTPYGGGAGMVMKVEPIWKAVQSVRNVQIVEEVKIDNKLSKRSDLSSRTILFSAKGKTYTQADVRRLAKYDQLIFICGRYEGVDERVVKYIADEEISIGDYVLTGGEIPAMVLVDSISRLVPGVLGNAESAQDESHTQKGTLEYPHYTKPEEFQNWKVPKILLSGDHQKIKDWREKKRFKNSKK